MATDFDSLWNAAADIMDDAVDGIVGDRLRYALDGVTFVVHPGFALDVVDGEQQTEGLDEDFAVRKRVKIRQSIVPVVSLQHRIQHPKLGPGSFRPTNCVPQTEGRYWLFDVQKVS